MAVSKNTPQHIPGVLPLIQGTKDEWHILLIEGTAEDPEVTWMHPPSCGVTVSTVPDRFSGAMVRYECHTQNDLDNGGLDGIFDRYATPDPLPRGIWAVHPWVEKCSGLDWTEYDGGWTVIPLVVVPDAA